MNCYLLHIGNMNYEHFNENAHCIYTIFIESTSRTLFIIRSRSLRIAVWGTHFVHPPKTEIQLNNTRI
jgi:hypothetical protein